MKQIFHIAICFLSIFVNAQEIPFSNFWNLISLKNPGFIGFYENPSFNLTYKNQYAALSSAYVSYVFEGTYPFRSLNSVISIGMMEDIAGSGVINTFYPWISYSYEININNDISTVFAIQGSYSYRSINTSKLVFESDILNSSFDYVNNLREKKYFFDFSIGSIMNFGESLFIGLSINHLTSHNEIFNRKYNLFAGGKIYLDLEESKEILPAIELNYQSDYIQTLCGANLKINSFIIGTWLRNDNFIKFNNLGFILGFLKNSYNFYYCYDVNLKKFSNFNFGFGNHEVTFLYIFKYNKKARNRKIEKIKCPKVVRY